MIMQIIILLICWRVFPVQDNVNKTFVPVVMELTSTPLSSVVFVNHIKY